MLAAPSPSTCEKQLKKPQQLVVCSTESSVVNLPWDAMHMRSLNASRNATRQGWTE